MSPDAPTTEPTVTPAQAEAQATITAIRADATHPYHRNDPQANAEMERLYKIRFPEPGASPAPTDHEERLGQLEQEYLRSWGTPGQSAAAPRPAAPTPPRASEQDEIRAKIAAARTAPLGVGESDRDRAEAITDLYRQLHELTSPPAGDPVITAAEAKLGDLTPDTPEWARQVAEVDRLVLAQPVPPEYETMVDQAVTGFGLQATPDERHALGQTCNVISFELGADAVAPTLARGLGVWKRSEDGDGDGVYETVEELRADLTTRWGRDFDRRLDDVREADAKLPTLVRQAWWTNPTLRYNRDWYVYLADIGAKIPVGPLA